MAFKAAFTDMDGTLLNADHRLSAYAVDVIKRLRQKGILFVVATGRPYADVFATLEKNNLVPDFIVTCNGANVFDKDRKPVILHDIDPHTASRLLKLAQRCGQVPGSSEPRYQTYIFRGAEWVADHVFPHTRKCFDAALVSRDIGDRVFSMPEEELTEVHELVVETSVPNGGLVPLEEGLAAEMAGELSWFRGDAISINVVAKGVTKGVAMEEVCALLGITPKETVAFGDAMNDYDMLRRAGKVFLPANSLPELQQKLPHAEMIGSNADDSVAKKLEELFLS